MVSTDTCTPTFIAALFTRAERWTLPKCSRMDKWITKRWASHMLGHSSAIKRCEVLTSATTRMHPEDVMLSEINQP